MRFRRLALPPVLAIVAVAGCARKPGLFSEQNARAHVEMLAGTIGSRPPGTEAHRRARAYIIDQLKIFGYEVRVQEADARRPELGRTARVANIIGVLPGSKQEAIGLLSHYDSRGDTPGAGDDAFGVAVSLEAARLIAASSGRQWTTYVLVTDAEEEGLMGAAALMNDAQVRDRLAVYLNVESSGSARPVMLFETGPANDWLVKQWARRAPWPRGGSFAIEIYKRLPTDTDFSIVKRHQVPGLNLAAVGDSYTYHTARDTPERLSSRALREAGDNVVAIVEGLQQRDITSRTNRDATYFDVGGAMGVSYGRGVAWATSLFSLLLGLLAWLRVTRFLLHEEGGWRWLLGLLWTILAALVTLAAMVLAAGAFRAAREVYHPWYARPDRFFVMLVAVGAAVGWMMARAGRLIPSRARGLRHPAVAWTYTLPAWIVLAFFTSWAAPAAAYLWTLPLLSAGACLLIVPAAKAGAVRIASVVVLAVTATLWLRDTVDLLRFMVAVFGRLPIVTPVYVYPGMIAAAGLMVAPPLFAAVARPAPLLRPSLATALVLAAVAISVLAAWLAPAYTREQPLRRHVRAIQEPGAERSLWKVGSLEPGLDLGDGAPAGWRIADSSVPAVPWSVLSQPFVFSTAAPPLGAAPAAIASYSTTPAALAAGTTLSISIRPSEPALSVAFVLPEGVSPARSNLPGAIRRGRWTATFVAVPPEGVAWEASFASASATELAATRVVVTSSGLPGAPGWQRLPPWLPQDHAVWNAWFIWVLDPTAPAPLEPVPPLR
jgi:hypothetical protein